MKQFLFCLSMAVCLNPASAQIAVSSNANAVYNMGGRAFPFSGASPVSNTRYVDLKDGTPFFEDSWTNGTIVTQDGKMVQDVPVKLNLMENKVYYKDSEGKELVIGIPLKEVRLSGTKKGNAHFINGDMLPAAKLGWYQLLVNDSLSLLKGVTKVFEQHTSYGSATEYSIKTQDKYIAFLDGQEYEIKKAADFTRLLPSKKSEIEKEIRGKEGKQNKDEQFALVAAYCNSLLKGKE